MNGWRRVGWVLVLLAWASGCQSVYYDTMEQFGVHKRDIFVDRVQSAMASQEAAKEEFQDALATFSQVVDLEPSGLKAAYESMSEAYEDAADRAQAVTDRVDAVESVSEALFEEWQAEIGQIQNRELRSSSARQLERSQRSYQTLITGMRRAESRMAPVLTAFNDQVLYLKHNLNAQAIASLKQELANVQSDVSRLIEDMEASIAQSQAFIRELEQVD